MRPTARRTEPKRLCPRCLPWPHAKMMGRCEPAKTDPGRPLRGRAAERAGSTVNRPLGADAPLAGPRVFHPPRSARAAGDMPPDATAVEALLIRTAWHDTGLSEWRPRRATTCCAVTVSPPGRRHSGSPSQAPRSRRRVSRARMARPEPKPQGWLAGDEGESVARMRITSPVRSSFTVVMRSAHGAPSRPVPTRMWERAMRNGGSRLWTALGQDIACPRRRINAEAQHQAHCVRGLPVPEGRREDRPAQGRARVG